MMRSKLTKESKEQIVDIFINGDFFGELNLFSSEETYGFDSYTISYVKIRTLTKQDMKV